MTKKRKANASGAAGAAQKRACVDQSEGRGGSAAAVPVNLPPYPDGFPRSAPKGEELLAFQPLSFPGTVHLVNRESEGKVEWAVLEGARVLGMDTETKPVFVKGAKPNPTALVQLATKDECWVFQLLDPFGISDAAKKRLQALLESPSVVKAGVAIHEDCRELGKFYLPSMKTVESVVDLQDIVRPYQLPSTGLRALAAMFLCRRIQKSQQCSNWGSARLSSAQLWYAAVDAWAGFRLHETLRSLFGGSDEWAPPRTIRLD